jgi:hypothetical protein
VIVMTGQQDAVDEVPTGRPSHRVPRRVFIFGYSHNLDAASPGLRRPDSQARTVAGTGVEGACEHSLREAKALSELYDFILVPWPRLGGRTLREGEWNTDWQRLGG